VFGATGRVYPTGAWLIIVQPTKLVFMEVQLVSQNQAAAVLDIFFITPKNAMTTIFTGMIPIIPGKINIGIARMLIHVQ